MKTHAASDSDELIANHFQSLKQNDDIWAAATVWLWCVAARAASSRSPSQHDAGLWLRGGQREASDSALRHRRRSQCGKGNKANGLKNRNKIKKIHFTAGAGRPNLGRERRGCERRAPRPRHSTGAELREQRWDGRVSAAIDVLDERTEVNIVITRKEAQIEDPADPSEIRRVGLRQRLTFVSGNLLWLEMIFLSFSPLTRFVEQPSAFSLSDVLIPPMANVLKVFLENGQTKSFKYDSTTTVQVRSAMWEDKVSSLIKLLSDRMWWRRWKRNFA